MEKDLLIYSILRKKPNAQQLNQYDIDKLQKDFNVKLPQDYIDLLLKANGGDIVFFDDEFDKSRYIVNDYLANEGLPYIQEFYDLNLILYFLEDKEDAPEYQELLDINLFPIGSDGSYAHEILIGVGENNFGKIHFYERCMLEVNDEYIHYVCSSFTEFIENFYLRKYE